MTKLERFAQLDGLLAEQDGMLQTSQAVARGIVKPIFYEYIKERKLEQVAHGIYVSEDTWIDAMFLLHLRCGQAVFSHESALFFHDLTDREPSPYAITVRRGYSTTRLKAEAIADELHIPFNREVNNQLRGVSRMESLKLILRNSPVCYSEQEKFLLAEKKNNIYRELLQNITSKDLADGAWTVLEKLHAVHIPMAIGSSSKNTPLIVEKLGIGKFFDAIVDGNQISHSKPDPEVFLLAAEKLHQKPSDCLVVEDAEAGVKAALNGGFPVAGIGPAKDCPNVNYPLLSLSELLAVEGHLA